MAARKMKIICIYFLLLFLSIAAVPVPGPMPKPRPAPFPHPLPIAYPKPIPKSIHFIASTFPELVLKAGAVSLVRNDDFYRNAAKQSQNDLKKKLQLLLDSASAATFRMEHSTQNTRQDLVSLTKMIQDPQLGTPPSHAWRKPISSFGYSAQKYLSSSSADSIMKWGIPTLPESINQAILKYFEKQLDDPAQKQILKVKLVNTIMPWFDVLCKGLHHERERIKKMSEQALDLVIEAFKQYQNPHVLEAIVRSICIAKNVPF